VKKFMDPDKRMSGAEAVARFVNDGESFVFANCLTGMPLALVHDLIRSGKKNLMLFQQGGIEEVDLLISAGAIDRLAVAYNFRMGGKRVTPPLDRALKEGRLQVQELTNFTLLAMMKAGAMGYPFMPVLGGMQVTDVVKKQGFLGDACFAEVKDPFDGEDVLVVKGYCPDFALMHVQRADKAGNGQLWGAMINSKWAALAAKRIILSAEEIVDTEVILSSPHLTIAPAHKVCAVVSCPWGAHPSELAGFYDYDMVFRALYFASLNNPEAMKAWMDEWIHGVSDRNEYRERYLGKFGREALEAIQARPFKSVPADYGFSFAPNWDEKGYSDKFGMSLDELARFMEEKGILREG
jgi:glutaconate CoA-transferase subunit A